MEWIRASMCPSGHAATRTVIPSDPHLDPTDDAVLIARSRSGDERAFATLVRRHQGVVERLVARMLGAGDEMEDVCQETFIRFHGALDQFRGDAAVGTYLSRIAMNLSLNSLRRRRWQLSRFLRHDVEPFALHEEPASDTGDPAVAGERHEALHAALGRLDPKHRAVVVLRMLENRSTQETAEVLGIPAGTVMSRLARALEKLQQDLRAHGMEAT